MKLDGGGASGLGNNAPDNLCEMATRNGSWETRPGYLKYVREAKARGLDCPRQINLSGISFSYGDC